MLCAHVALPLCACIPGVSPSSYEDNSPIGLGPHPVTSFNLITSLKTLSPNTVTLAVRASAYELAGMGHFSP